MFLFSVQNADNLKRHRLWPVNDDVAAITGDRPETKRAGCEVGSGMPTQRSFGKERTSVINGLFYAVSCRFAGFRNIRPDFKVSALARGVRA